VHHYCEPGAYHNFICANLRHGSVAGVLKSIIELTEFAQDFVVDLKTFRHAHGAFIILAEKLQVYDLPKRCVKSLFQRLIPINEVRQYQWFEKGEDWTPSFYDRSNFLKREKIATALWPNREWNTVEWVKWMGKTGGYAKMERWGVEFDQLPALSVRGSLEKEAARKHAEDKANEADKQRPFSPLYQPDPTPPPSSQPPSLTDSELTDSEASVVWKGKGDEGRDKDWLWGQLTAQTAVKTAKKGYEEENGKDGWLSWRRNDGVQSKW
jgi:hypothetical protein